MSEIKPIVKEITLTYCPANRKYDSVEDGVWTGKWYTIESFAKHLATKYKSQDKMEQKIDLESIEKRIEELHKQFKTTMKSVRSTEKITKESNKKFKTAMKSARETVRKMVMINGNY